MTTKNDSPCLKELLLGYQRFNEWQEKETQASLLQLSVADALEQFFELCNLVRAWRPDAKLDTKWIRDKQESWVKLYEQHKE